MCETLACWLARRAGQLYHLSRPADRSEILAAGRERGCPVRWSAALSRSACIPGRFVALALDASAADAAHELCHWWLAENYAWGIVYRSEDFLLDDEEAVAREFAAYLCGP